MGLVPQVMLRPGHSTTASTSSPRNILLRSVHAHVERVAKVKAAVQERLTREVTYWDHRASELQFQTDAGKSPRMNPDRGSWTCR
jgi:hypothetical protein